MHKQFITRILVAVILLFLNYISGEPEHKDCKFMEKNETVVRIRDTGDCHKFYYCTHALATPYLSTCPHDNGIWLYFNPNTTNCGYTRDWRCWDHRQGIPGIPGPTTTTTPAPPTTRAPRPPLLVEENPIIDCSKTPCGLYPNRYGSCDQYVLCVNGQNFTKTCHAGQLFDVKTKECQPKSVATCWTEINAGPHIRKTGECPFHEKNSSTPVQELTDGIVLQNPIVTNWGEWQNWQMCPTGKFAMGIYAWRRLLMDRQKKDFAGIVALSFQCQQPGFNAGAMDFIESLAPNLPHDGWPKYYICKGAVVGFRLNSAKQLADNVATDNVQAICSCSEPAFKPYDQAIYAPQNGHRGDWTEAQVCRKGQAVCGMQTQMHAYKEREWGTWDNTGLNNFRVKCCDVPNPLETCSTEETRIPVRTCDNTKNKDDQQRCDFESGVGLTLLYETKSPLYGKMVDFYTSIGYTFESAKTKLEKKIEEENLKRFREGIFKVEYHWDETVPAMHEDETVTSRKVWVPPSSKLELFQIVGKCSYFLMRTNRYVQVVTGKGGRQETFFEV